MASRAASTKKAPAKNAAVIDTNIEMNTGIVESADIKVETKVQANDTKDVFIAKPVIDPHSTVMVINGFNGKLVYNSRKTGERYVWDQFGDEQEMEIQELKNAKSADKAYFSQNWFLFNDTEIIDYLGVGMYYKNALRYEDFDELFEMSPAELAERCSKLSQGQKKSVAYRAAQLVNSGEIDSRRRIAALEESLGVELIEH